MSGGVCWVTVNAVILSDLMWSVACGSEVRSLTAPDCARLRRDDNYHNIDVHQQSVFGKQNIIKLYYILFSFVITIFVIYVYNLRTKFLILLDDQDNNV